MSPLPRQARNGIGLRVPKPAQFGEGENLVRAMTKGWDDPVVIDELRLGVAIAPGSSEPKETLGFDRLLAEVDALRTVSALQERLFERALGGGDVRLLVDTVSRLIGRPVTAVGPIFGSREVAESGPATEPASIGLAPAVTVPIVLDGTIVGELVTPGVPETPDLTIRLVLASAARIIAIMLQRHRVGANASRIARQELLVDILRGEVASEVELRARGFALGCDCDLSRPASLLVVEASDGVSPDHVIEDRLIGAVSSALAGQPLLVGAFNGRVAILLTNGLEGTSKQGHVRVAPERGATETVRVALLELAMSTPPVLARATGFSTPADGPRLYAEAVEAIRLARRLGRTDRVIQVDDRELRAYQILAGDHNQNRSRAFVEDVLGKLATYDARHQGSFVATLEAYLDHNGNLGATAQALFIHLSTLKYRLTRITKIGGLSFHDPQDRFHAQLALRLRRILPDDSFVQTR